VLDDADRRIACCVSVAHASERNRGSVYRCARVSEAGERP
jgi:hypothetical protein